MKRILILNNYSISRVRSEIASLKKPSHHLYGIIELEKAGYTIISFDPNKYSLLYKLGNTIAKISFLNFGDLYQQWQAIVRRKEYDIVYAPCQDTTILLGVLSYFNIYQKPIIAIAHHPVLKGKLANFRKYSLYFAVNGHYRFLSLCKIIESQLNDIANRIISQEMYWGPELKYYDIVKSTIKETAKVYDLIAVGRTGRDYSTLINAFNNTSIRVCICCNGELKNTLPSIYSNNITIRWLQSEEALDYIELIKIYQTAKILAVPMYDEDSLCGLTSVTDALALGMPLIITRNKYINIDPELNEFGIWVNAYDQDGWQIAAKKILNDNELYLRMSKNAKHSAESKFNINLFSVSLDKIIQNI